MALYENEVMRVERVEESNPTSMDATHIHDYYEIYYLMAGNRKYFINHTLYIVEPGDVILVNKGDIHITTSYSASDHYHERYLLTFSDQFLQPLMQHISKNDLLECFHSKKVHITSAKRHNFEALLNKLCSEYQGKDSYSSLLSNLHMMELLIFLSRRVKHGSMPMDEFTVHEERIQEVCKYITNYYNQSITLEEAAKIAYMSPTYFSKKFKKITGFGFNEYLNNVRIKMASNMLTETQYSVAEIAQYCGYKDGNYFGDVFKKIMNVSPSKYRKLNYTF